MTVETADGRHNGFTLVELMIVVAIVAILAAFAYPGYQDAVRKGNRSDGEGLLLQIEALQGRYLYDNGTYTADLTDLGFATAGSVASSNGHYQVSVLAATAACPITSCYALQAVPQGAQTDDGRLDLTSTGIKRRDKNQDGDTTDAGEDSW